MAGHTPLFFCTGMMGNDLTLSIAKLLVKAGANVNAVNRMGSSPLFEATMDRKVQSVDFLLVNKLVWRLDINKQMTIIGLFYPPSSGISSCVRTVYTVMCHHTWRSPAIHLRVGSDSGLISRHELRALSIGFLFPNGSCSEVR